MRLRVITIGYLFLLALFNVINIIAEKKPATDIIMYAGIFFAIMVIFLILKNNTNFILGISFILIGAVGEVLADPGIGIILFTYGFYYISANKKIFYAAIFIAIISIFVRFYYTEYSIATIFNYILLHGFFYLLYYNSIHPKIIKPDISIKEIPGFTRPNVEIIQNLINGKIPKEMVVYDEKDILLTRHSIYKRITRMKTAHDWDTNEQMIYELSKNGHLRPNLD